MKRRLNLAAGLMHSPQLLLLDEPTVGVDPQSRNHIFEGVRALNRQGLTVLYTSHYMEEVEALCDRVGIMDGGKLIACDTIPNLVAKLGGAVIEVGLENQKILEALLAALRNIHGVERADLLLPDETAQNGHTTLQIRAVEPHRVLPKIVVALNEDDASLLSLQIKQPNLEDVFLALTGKTLRD
jgi:ABC-2 type transport system ATP-binding protein